MKPNALYRGRGHPGHLGHPSVTYHLAKKIRAPLRPLRQPIRGNAALGLAARLSDPTNLASRAVRRAVVGLRWPAGGR
jgi:hypothetical protein